MINAEEFECRVPSEGPEDVILTCMSSGGVNGVELVSAVATALAAFLALIFGAVEIVRSREQRTEQRLAEERQTLEQQYYSVTNLLRQVAADFPYGNTNLMMLLQGQVTMYKEFLRDSPLVNEELYTYVEKIMQRFVLVVHTYSSAVSDAADAYGEFWHLKVQNQKSLLEVVQYHFGTALAQWHRNGRNLETALGTLKWLDQSTQQLLEKIDGTFAEQKEDLEKQQKDMDDA